ETDKVLYWAVKLVVVNGKVQGQAVQITEAQYYEAQNRKPPKPKKPKQTQPKPAPTPTPTPQTTPRPTGTPFTVW
ncbi:MAG TPA: hypothetical protein VFR78_05105, partial [Pyrinomonadaceae bacterium]|nr:hypothetical protein [Pyrinomonadaceae bacterium]